MILNMVQIILIPIGSNPSGRSIRREENDTMNKLYDTWSSVNRDIDKSTDSQYIAETQVQLNDLARKMCKQLSTLDFLEESLHLHLHDHYRQIRDVCKTQGYPPL